MDYEKLKQLRASLADLLASLNQCSQRIDSRTQEIEALYDLDPHRFQYGIVAQPGNLAERAQRSIANKHFAQRDQLEAAYKNREQLLSVERMGAMQVDAAVATIRPEIERCARIAEQLCNTAAEDLLKSAVAAIQPFFETSDAEPTAREFPKVAQAMERCWMFQRSSESFPRAKVDAHLVDATQPSEAAMLLHQAETIIKMVEG